MARGHLSSFFISVATKRLSAVEAHPERSNQHEFDGVTGLKEILGTVRKTFEAEFVYLADDEEDCAFAPAFVTWYDARENHPTRSEFRLYFPRTPVSELAAEGDLVVFGRRPDDGLMVIVARSGSTAEHQLAWLFDLDELTGTFAVSRISDDAQSPIGLAARLILERLGIESPPEPASSYLEEMLRAFEGRFPTTAAFSSFARATLPGLSAVDGPDFALMAWMEREEALFRTLEGYFVSERLKSHFEDVETFISYSLSVQNRRKSRVGHALENHVEFIFRELDLRFDRNARTENKSKPDFLFPGEREYHEQEFPDSELVMLAVKSTCKDRWRQVLAEADRIQHKHLLTLEPGISRSQTDEMASQRLQLVVPQPLHGTYAPAQHSWILELAEFIDSVKQRQT